MCAGQLEEEVGGTEDTGAALHHFSALLTLRKWLFVTVESVCQTPNFKTFLSITFASDVL